MARSKFIYIGVNQGLLNKYWYYVVCSFLVGLILYVFMGGMALPLIYMQVICIQFLSLCA